jgi:hypothetical protein
LIDLDVAASGSAKFSSNTVSSLSGGQVAFKNLSAPNFTATLSGNNSWE